MCLSMFQYWIIRQSLPFTPIYNFWLPTFRKCSDKNLAGDHKDIIWQAIVAHKIKQSLDKAQ